ncbi:MAG TPA: diaminopimelate epimerase [Candidatus Fournierella merdigallinarum]|nr:diaminopimelate epimerase [Candidatus Fournierella merdigallinarum]
MVLDFTKMEGCGNDYIYVDCLSGLTFDPAAAAVALSPRHFAVGADGLICICKSEVADAKMRMFNADGSEGAMCGNGVRCVAQWLFEHGLVGSEATVETLSGVKAMARTPEGQWQVDMGVARFDPAAVGAAGLGDGPLVNTELMVAGRAWPVTCVSMGNPHCVTFVPDVAGVDLPRLGLGFEHHRAFAAGINTEFIQQLAPDRLKMRVWERGSGETLACGTGACASVAACVALGRCQPDTDVKVELLGGTLTIRVDKDWRVRMTGPARTAFTGRATI